MALDSGRMRPPPGPRVEPSWRPHTRSNHQSGSAVVEFALVAPLAILIALAVAQFALFLYERNVVMGSLSAGARVAATSGRTVADGQRAAGNLLREALGHRIAATVAVRGGVENGLVVLRSDATLPSFVPGLPGLRIHMTAAMHKEENLDVQDATPVVGPPGAPAGTTKAGT
jgi:Flp pilus assembly protein TadG